MEPGLNLSLPDDPDRPLWHSPYHPVVQALIWIVATLLCLETIVGNAMVIIAYKLERSISKQVNNRYIVSLAISDLIIGIEGIPLFTVYVVNGDRWPLGPMACETWLFLDYTLCLVSILTVLLITADRYMSVCHTAKYLKWQSPAKTQVLIVFSWILPALIFGLMIYGWSFLSGEASMSDSSTDCSAPFLSNPYVNMGMYVAYYWTTLIAMLILYKGIHKAAKNLEKKAKAKEHRHIALLLTQRLGTQVGVSLMLQSKRKESLSPPGRGDSGYHTTTTTATLVTAAPHTRTRTAATTTMALGGPLPGENPDELDKHELARLINECREEAEVSKKGIKREPLKRAISPQSLRRRHRKRSSTKSNSRVASAADSKKVSVQEPPAHTEPLVPCRKSESCQFNLIADTEQISQDPEPNTATQGMVESVSRISEWEVMGRTDVPMAVAECTDTPQENGFKPSRVHVSHAAPLQGTGWLARLTDRLRRWTGRPRRKRSRPGSRRDKNRKKLSRSHSISSTDSESSTMDSPKHNTPHLETGNHADGVHKKSLESPDNANDLLGSETVRERKLSHLTTFTKDTKDRMMSSLFAPISSALNRSRKRTKAERRAHKAFRTITFIVGLFAILWSPYYVVATVYGFCKGQCIPSVIYNLSYYMCYLNSSGNPFAYALANRQFRLAFLRMLRGNFRRVP